jgi:cysteine synthase A
MMKRRKLMDATTMRTTDGRGRLFASVLETVGNTPAIRVNNLAPASVEMYVKAEAFNPAGSVKDRLALNIIEEAERDGSLSRGQTVVEATSGNTGIGLAMVCAAKGYPLVVTMADSFSIERRKLMRILGAKVVLTPRAQKGFGMYRKAVELAETNGWFLARQFETKANAAIHEATTAREIINDFAVRGSTGSLPATAPAAQWRASAACCAESGRRHGSCSPSPRMRN